MNERLLPTELEAAIKQFVETLELIFDADWKFTKEILASDTHGWYISNEPGATFLNPGIEDERNNWHNRGAFLREYRELRAMLGPSTAFWAPDNLRNL